VSRRVGDPVVGEGGDAQPGDADSPDGFEHDRPRHTRLGDLRHQVSTVDREAVRAAVGLERLDERPRRQLAALEPGPGPLLARRDHHAVDRVGVDTALALVARDGVERGILHDPADVEHDRRDLLH
jgi:hypothetical protein